MVENKCSMMHKLGPFIVNKNGLVTRTCFCCGEVIKYNNIGEDIKYNNIGEDIKEAIVRQEDVNFFSDFMIGKKINYEGSDDFIKHVSFIFDDIAYLFINEEAQNKLIKNISFYNELINKDSEEELKLINDVCKYFQLFFKKEKYEYKFGFDSFPESDVDMLDSMSDNISNRFNELLNKRNHLSK